MQALLNAAAEYSESYSVFRASWKFQKSRNNTLQLAIIAFDFVNEMDSDLVAFRKCLEEDEKIIRSTTNLLIRQVRMEHHEQNISACVGLESLISWFGTITDYTV